MPHTGSLLYLRMRSASRCLHTMLLTLLLCCSCSQVTISYPQTPVAELTYTNDEWGYTITYPSNWFPSGLEYSNAFEIRNYDSKNLQSVPEGNRATLIIVDTINDSPEATHAFLDGLLQGGNAEDLSLVIDGHRAVRVYREVPVQPLGPGASRDFTPDPSTNQPTSYANISTYVANGVHLLSIEAVVAVGADASVMEEITSIEDNVSFH